MPDAPATTNGTPTAPVDPAQAQADLDKAKADARKAAADAAAAETAADKARREEDDATSTAAIAERDAKRTQAIAEANRDTAVARQSEVSSLIPDFTKIEKGKLEVAGDVGIEGSAVSFKALSRAAHQVGEHVRFVTKDVKHWRILVTSETDLAASDAAYQDVTSGLHQLQASGNELLALPLPEPPAREAAAQGSEIDKPKREFDPALGAVAAALPGLVSLFSANRSVSSVAVDVTDFAAAAAVAGDLKGNMETGEVFHDTLRTLPSGHVAEAAAEILSIRQKAVARKLELEARKASMTGEQARLRERDSELAKALVQAGAPTQTIAEERTRIERQLDAIDVPLTSATSQAALADNLLAAIDKFTASMNAVPTGARLSPLAAAALLEGLHVEAKDGGFTHLLLVKAEAASSTQLVSDLPLLAKDRYSVLGAASITYTLLGLPRGDVKKSGVESATTVANGRIGSTFTLQEA